MKAKWKTCSHNWTAVQYATAYGTVYQDECLECGCIGMLANSPDENGFYKIVARPMATIINLEEFRKSKGTKDGVKKSN